ncbi:HNH endonuclease [Roseovarius sp.]|uniref:HNH endonuclease n=1 Tax=Roseovarius sp. TaxID=1486281 RepID=UPI0035155D54
MTWGFELGRTYNRRRDIHAKFAGQQQGGIITPKAHNLIIIVTGEEGGQHGYTDTLRPDGVFEYYGEGQIGDMAMVRGNRAVANHTADGKDLLLFRKAKEGLRFEGQYIVEGILERPAPDTEGNIRNAFVFELRPLDAVIEALDSAPIANISGEISELRKRALEAASTSPKVGQARLSTVFERSKAVRDYILARANGKCEDCGEPAPFLTPSHTPFLEVHHIRRLSDGGPDDPRFMIGLCPNCHRGAHFGHDADERNDDMLSYVKAIEGN